MTEQEKIITQTKQWIIDVVIGCNFCPFAAREVKRGTIAYKVVEYVNSKQIIATLLQAVAELESNETIETTLVIIPVGVEKFTKYLQLVVKAEDALIQNGFEGIYQLASFHPNYLFSNSSVNDAANYTNRSPYPMLHLLREASLTKAIASHPNVDNIPATNIAFANSKGLAYMKLLRDTSIILLNK